MDLSDQRAKTRGLAMGGDRNAKHSRSWGRSAVTTHLHATKEGAREHESKTKRERERARARETRSNENERKEA